ncbi:MAG: hypothetical protein M1824_005517 [Vezdaea acicularis]|nr:MAG: hypothetical protein M1824_005517 [Vezdaea acicularis]
MHIHDNTTNISVKVQALANNKILNEYHSARDGHKVTSIIPVISKEQIKLKCSYKTATKETLEWDFSIDGVLRFTMFSCSEAPTWKFTNKDFEFCYDARHQEGAAVECNMIVEPISGPLQQEENVKLVPGIGEIKIQIFRGGIHSTELRRPSVTDMECWKSIIPSQENLALPPTHWISLVPAPPKTESPRRKLLRNMPKNLNLRDPNGPWVEFIFLYRDSGKLASLADIGLQDNADALDFSFSSTPRLSAIKEEYSQLDDTDHRQSSVIWNHDQSLIDVDTHSTGFVDDEVSIGRGLECTATKAQEVQAQRKRTYRDMALSEEAVAACPEKLNDAVMSKARERFEAAKLAAAERRRQRDEGIQKRTKELDEADRRQQALQTALDQRYEQLCVELEAREEAEEEKYRFETDRLAAESKRLTDRCADIKTQLALLENKPQDS